MRIKYLEIIRGIGERYYFLAAHGCGFHFLKTKAIWMSMCIKCTKSDIISKTNLYMDFFF